MAAAVPTSLLPVAGKPLLHYPLSVLMLAGVRDVLIVAPASELRLIRTLLGSGEHVGLRVEYAAEASPGGAAGALLAAAEHASGDQMAFVPGHDVFHGPNFRNVLREHATALKGSALFAYGARPGRSAPTGLRFYDNDLAEVADIAADVIAHGRSDLSAIDHAYSERGLTTVVELGRGFAWIPVDTPEALLDASWYVRTIEQRQGVGIACLEEVALRMGFIDADACAALGARHGDSPYGRYVREVAAAFGAAAPASPAA